MKREIKFGKWILRVELEKVEEQVAPAVLVDEGKALVDSWFVELNNTYLRLERAGRPVSRANGNRLVELVNLIYPFASEQTCNEYWMGELEKLPGWDQW